MIFSNKRGVSEYDFTSLLEKTTRYLTKHIPSVGESGALGFEGKVYEAMCMVSEGTDFHGSIMQTGRNEFPDILAKKYFGVEVKTTKEDKWWSAGNSIFETTRLNEVERIFILFAKFGGDFGIRYKPYQECLSEIRVTHSPRYTVNMVLPEGESIFHKMEVDYNTFRKSTEKIRFIKEYYRRQLKKGEEFWWMGDIEQDESELHPIIRSFQVLEKTERERFIINSMILFPEIFGNKHSKFERAVLYLFSGYGAVCSNIRDVFTSGGKQKIAAGNSRLVVSQIQKKLFDRAFKIKERMMEMEEYELGKRCCRKMRLE